MSLRRNMESKIRLKLIVLSLVALFPLSACQSSTPSSSDRALQSSQKETKLTADGNRMSSNEQHLPEVRLQAAKLYPLDEGPQDSSFAGFRNKLLKAAKDHDVAFLLSILHPQIINNSDGERGVKEFKDQWKLDQPDSRIWETLATVVSMGGSFRVNDGQNEFCAPYVTSQWPNVVSQLPKSADPLDYEVIIEKDVALRSDPNPNAPVVTSLSYDVVKVHSGGTVPLRSQTDDSTWLKIT